MFVSSALDNKNTVSFHAIRSRNLTRSDGWRCLPKIIFFFLPAPKTNCCVVCYSVMALILVRGQSSRGKRARFNFEKRSAVMQNRNEEFAQAHIWRTEHNCKLRGSPFSNNKTPRRRGAAVAQLFFAALFSLVVPA